MLGNNTIQQQNLTTGQVGNTTHGPINSPSRSSSIQSQDLGYKHLTRDVSLLMAERLDIWRRLIKGLIGFFTEIAKSEKWTADSYRKCAEMNIMSNVNPTDVSTTYGQFAINIANAFKDVPHRLATEHEGISRGIDNETILSLRKLKTEIKKKQLAIIDTAELRNKESLKSREELDKHFVHLRNAIQHSKGTHIKLKDQPEDPWVAYIAYRDILVRHTREFEAREVERNKELEDYTVFESFIFVTFKNAILNFTAMNDANISRSNSWLHYQNIVNNLQPEQETNAFVSKVREYLSEARPDAQLKELDVNGSCRIVKEGMLLRPKTLPGWKEHYFVLTSAGYLHELKERKDWNTVGFGQLGLINSICLADCVLGAHSLKDDAPQEFEIIEKRNSGMFSKSKRVYRIRGMNLVDAKIWWEALAPFAKTALTSAYVPGPMEEAGEEIMVDDPLDDVSNVSIAGTPPQSTNFYPNNTPVTNNQLGNNSMGISQGQSNLLGQNSNMLGTQGQSNLLGQNGSMLGTQGVSGLSGQQGGMMISQGSSGLSGQQRDLLGNSSLGQGGLMTNDNVLPHERLNLMNSQGQSNPLSQPDNIGPLGYNNNLTQPSSGLGTQGNSSLLNSQGDSNLLMNPGIDTLNLGQDPTLRSKPVHQDSDAIAREQNLSM